MNWWWGNQNGENKWHESKNLWKWFLWNPKKELLWNFRNVKNWVKKSDPAKQLFLDEQQLKQQRANIMAALKDL